MEITEFSDNVYSYGMVRYFKGDRLFNEKPLFEFNKGKIKAKELVTFDMALMDMVEINSADVEEAKKNSEQIFAIIIRLEIHRKCLFAVFKGDI